MAVEISIDPLHRLRFHGAERPSWDGRIAQVVEQLTLNQRVVGSSPTAPTKDFKGLDQVLSECSWLVYSFVLFLILPPAV